jgi:hypothetical protein
MCSTDLGRNCAMQLSTLAAQYEAQDARKAKAATTVSIKNTGNSTFVFVSGEGCKEVFAVDSTSPSGCTVPARDPSALRDEAALKKPRAPVAAPKTHAPLFWATRTTPQDSITGRWLCL